MKLPQKFTERMSEFIRENNLGAPEDFFANLIWSRVRESGLID